MRKLYTILAYLCAPFFTIYCLWRYRKDHNLRSRIIEYYGFTAKLKANSVVWVHAASVGEVNAAAPLIKQLVEKHPECTFVVTTVTPTGAARVNALFADQVHHCYAPFDLPDAILRFYRRIKPQLLINIETELWPNRFAFCHRHNIPIIIANATLSRRSLHRLQKFSGLAQAILPAITLCLTQSPEDDQRLRQFGLTQNQVQLVGNLKYEISLDTAITDQAKQLRRDIAHKSCVLIVASSHEPEEAMALTAFTQIKQRYPDALLILAPRHPDRFPQVEHLVKQTAFTLQCYHENACPQDSTDIFLVNCLGKLLSYYAISDIAFVGGSFADRGGHNILEPAALGLPIICGPHTYNITDLLKNLAPSEGVFIIHDAEELARTVMDIMTDEHKHQQLSARLLQLVNNHRGALNRHYQAILPYLEALDENIATNAAEDNRQFHRHHGHLQP